MTELAGDEEVLWTGQPRRIPCALAEIDRFLFGLIVLAIVRWCMWPEVMQDPDSIPAVVFVVFWIGLSSWLLAHPIIAAIHSTKARYIVTTSRAIVSVPRWSTWQNWGERVYELPLKEPPVVTNGWLGVHLILEAEAISHDDVSHEIQIGFRFLADKDASFALKSLGMHYE